MWHLMKLVIRRSLQVLDDFIRLQFAAIHFYNEIMYELFSWLVYDDKITHSSVLAFVHFIVHVESENLSDFGETNRNNRRIISRYNTMHFHLYNNLR